jgi:hypothetical protein
MAEVKNLQAAVQTAHTFLRGLWRYKLRVLFGADVGKFAERMEESCTFLETYPKPDFSPQRRRLVGAGQFLARSCIKLPELLARMSISALPLSRK